MPTGRQLLLGACIGLLPALSSAVAVAQAAKPTITEVLVDLDLDMIEIRGAGFGSVQTITLGDDATVGAITDDCVIQPETIICTLSDGLPPPGDYRLTVARNPGLRDSYDLTIGSSAVSIDSCPAGSAIREIDNDGSVVCEIIDASVAIDSCPAGSAIREINADGSVICENIGSLNLSIVQRLVTIDGSVFGQEEDVSCGPGGTLVNGGYDCPGIVTNFAVNASHPISPTTWRVKFSLSVDATVQCLIVAQCDFE